MISLNPYYTGSYSMRLIWQQQRKLRKLVLILIILEVTLWDFEGKLFDYEYDGLNPYYTGSYSMREELCSVTGGVQGS